MTIGQFVGFLMLSWPANSALAASVATGPACELHVWGAGRPNVRISKRLQAIIERSNTPAMLDPTNPLSNVSLFNTVNRAKGLPDDSLRRLMPDAGSIIIVRHDALVDTDTSPLEKIRAPMARATNGCYADLVVANVYAIFPNPNAPFASGVLPIVIGSLIDGGNRLVADFFFQRFSGGSPLLKFRRKNDTPLPHFPWVTRELEQAVVASTNANFALFANGVAERRRD